MTHPLHRWPAPKTFTEPGDEIRGTILAWDGTEAKYPSLHIRTADGLVRIVRVTQARLHERLVELLPDPGDDILIRYDGEADRSAPGMSRTKGFTVKVRRSGAQTDAPGPSGGTGTNGRGSAAVPENVTGAGS